MPNRQEFVNQVFGDRIGIEFVRLRYRWCPQVLIGGGVEVALVGEFGGL